MTRWRFGLRAPDDPFIRGSVVLADALLKTDTPNGPVWHRYRNDGYGYDRDYAPGPRRYSYAEPVAPYAGRCAPRELVKERLYRDGWRDFHDGDVRGEIATVHARRPNGRLFVLAIHRCSGEIVRADPLEGGPVGPYAYGPQPRRWDRAY